MAETEEAYYEDNLVSSDELKAIKDFVVKYYVLTDNFRDELHAFYEERSLIDQCGVKVFSLQEIKNFLMLPSPLTHHVLSKVSATKLFRAQEPERLYYNVDVSGYAQISGRNSGEFAQKLILYKMKDDETFEKFIIKFDSYTLLDE